jgi:Alcohol dehydrogenase GroES-like domain
MRQRRRSLPAPPEPSDGVPPVQALPPVAATANILRTSKMRALVFRRYGRPDQVTFADAPRPVPRPNEILVQVHAAGLNPIDNMIPKGTFRPILRFQLPATLGSDLAGMVPEVGHHVTRFKLGDAVSTSFVLVTCILLFLTAPLFLVTKRPFVLRRKLDPN